MKYKPTILNIASLLLIVVDNYIYWTSYLKGEIYEYGFVALILSIIIGVVGLSIDFVLQKLLKNYWIINAFGLVFLLLFTAIYYYNSREKTIILPNEFSGTFTIVYGVNGTKPLFISNPTFGYKLEIIKTKVLYTKTLLADDIWNTKFQTASGIKLDKNKSNPRVIEIKLGKFNCQGKEWEYRTWLVKKNNQIIETKNIDSITIKNMEDYCDNH